MKAYEVVISGSYRTADHEVVDYSNVRGVIPFTDLEYAEASVRTRYAQIWITNDPRFSRRLYSVRECYIDAMDETFEKFTPRSRFDLYKVTDRPKKYITHKLIY